MSHLTETHDNAVVELPPPGTPIIEVTDIGKSYGSVIALRDEVVGGGGGV